MHEKIKELLHFTFNAANNDNFVLDIETVNRQFAEMVQQTLGYDIDGYVVTIDRYGIKHTFDKHGNQAREAKQGQLAVAENDFDDIHNWIGKPDKILKKKFKTASANRDAFIAVKQLDVFYYVVFEIRQVSGLKKQLYKKNRIVLQTMYKKTSCNE